jgi:hypothetical protein
MKDLTFLVANVTDIADSAICFCIPDALQGTSNPRVYAAGDAAGVGPPLTPVSSHDARRSSPPTCSKVLLPAQIIAAFRA